MSPWWTLSHWLTATLDWSSSCIWRPLTSPCSLCEGAEACTTAWLKLTGRVKAVGASTREGRTNPRLRPHGLTNQQLVVTTVIFFIRKLGLTAKAQKENGFPSELPVAKDFFVSAFHSALTSMLGPQVRHAYDPSAGNGGRPPSRPWVTSFTLMKFLPHEGLGLWLHVPQPGSPREGAVTMLSSRPCCDAPSCCCGSSLCGLWALWGTKPMQGSQWRWAPSKSKS